MKEIEVNAGKNESASLQKYTWRQEKLPSENEINPINSLMMQRTCKSCRSSQEDLQQDLAALPSAVRRSASISLQRSLGNRFVQGLAVQAKSAPNRTGMPDQLKLGIETISGLDLSSVRVHYGSSKPAEIGALAYTQGQEIHVASGQEKHLPHEAWHAVQQMQGRVKPTLQTKDGISINDDRGLEHEADEMGAAAIQERHLPLNAWPEEQKTIDSNSVAQRMVAYRYMSENELEAYGEAKGFVGNKNKNKSQWITTNPDGFSDGWDAPNYIYRMKFTTNKNKENYQPTIDLSEKAGGGGKETGFKDSYQIKSNEPDNFGVGANKTDEFRGTVTKCEWTERTRELGFTGKKSKFKKGTWT